MLVFVLIIFAFTTNAGYWLPEPITSWLPKPHPQTLQDDFHHYQTIFSTCPAEALFEPQLFQEWCDQRIKELREMFVSPQEAFDILFENQRDFIEKALPDYTFLLKKESYWQHNLPAPLDDMGDWLALLKLLLVVDYAHEPTSTANPPPYNRNNVIDHDFIHQAFTTQDLNKMFHKDALAKILYTLKIVEQDTPLKLAIFPCPKTEFSLLDYLLALRDGTLLFPFAHDFTNCEQWTIHNHGLRNIWCLITEHDIGGHTLPTIIEGELCNSTFLPKEKQQSVLQTLAHHLLNEFQQKLHHVSFFSQIASILQPSTARNEALSLLRERAMDILGYFSVCHEQSYFVPWNDFHAQPRENVLIANGVKLPEFHNGLPEMIESLFGCNQDHAYTLLEKKLKSIELRRYFQYNISEAQIKWAQNWEYSGCLSDNTLKARFALEKFKEQLIQSCTSEEAEIVKKEFHNSESGDRFDFSCNFAQSAAQDIWICECDSPYCFLLALPETHIWYTPKKHRLKPSRSLNEKILSARSAFTALTTNIKPNRLFAQTLRSI